MVLILLTCEYYKVLVATEGNPMEFESYTALLMQITFVMDFQDQELIHGMISEEKNIF